MHANRTRSSWSRAAFFVAVVAFAAFAAAALFAGAHEAVAAVPSWAPQDATKVDYRHNGRDDFQVQDPGWVQVYCMDPARGYRDDKTNQNYRWKVDLKANASLIDTNQNQGTNASNPPGSANVHKLVSILWYAQKNNADKHDTQKAVWWFVTNGGDENYADNKSQYNNWIVKGAGEGGWQVPSNYKLWMYVPDTEVYGGVSSLQNSVRLETKTADKASDKASDKTSDKTADKKSESSDASDKSETNAASSSEAQAKAAEEPRSEEGKAEGEDAANGKQGESAGAVELSELPNNEEIGGVTLPVDVMPEADPATQSTSAAQADPAATSASSPGIMKTTVKVGGTSADGTTLLTLPVSESTMAVVDTIDYAGFVPDATYEVTGEVIRFTADDTAGTTVCTATDTLVASPTGAGVWLLNFGMVELLPDLN